jgi:hypothetical protein
MLGGKMVDFNLFPQDRSVNRGMQRLLEMAIFIFLKAFENSRVTFKANLYYDNESEKPNRPFLNIYRVRFEGKKVFPSSKSIKKNIFYYILVLKQALTVSFFLRKSITNRKGKNTIQTKSDSVRK